MRFEPTDIDGLWEVTLEPFVDERGFLARTYCVSEFADHGLNVSWPQSNLSLTREKGMLRGMHFQVAPRAEIKYVRCLQGLVFDVIVDLRPSSPTRGQWRGFELGAENRRGLYIPAGFAHGFQCLTDNCLMFYQMSESYDATLARGVNWADPDLKIAWPIHPAKVSARDQGWPLLRQLEI